MTEYNEYVETYLCTINKNDVTENRFFKNTEKDGYVWFSVIYYDDENKEKCFFSLRVKKNENILAVIRINIALRSIENRNKELKCPDIYNKEETILYIDKAIEFFDLDKHITDIPSVVERVLHPNDLNTFYEFDFYETSLCKGCRENKNGLLYHKNGCF